MKVGIFGGTFNPIHYGHLINAEITAEKFDLGTVLFVPAKYPVHKKLADGISADDRLNMLTRAITGNQRFKVSSLEIDREGPSYTITTMRSLLEQDQSIEYMLIIGKDSLNEIPAWKEADSLLKMVKIIVMNRTHSEMEQETSLPDARGIFFADNPLIEISSSYIRNRIKEHRSIKYLTPDPVIDYIIKKELYQN